MLDLKGGGDGSDGLREATGGGSMGASGVISSVLHAAGEDRRCLFMFFHFFSFSDF